MISSDTSAPVSITRFAASPSGVPALTAARSMSPVEICGMPNLSRMKAAWVPLPAPGGPSRINRMGSCSEVPWVARWDDGQMLPVTEQLAHASEIFVGVDTRRGRRVGHFDDDPIPVPERTQLLQRLERLDRRNRQRRKRPQEMRSIGVQTVMPIERQPRRNHRVALVERATRPWNGRPAEIERAVARVEHDLDDVR